MNNLTPTCVPFLLLATATAQTAWTNVTNTVHPSARFASAMVFDQARQRCVLFGGHDDSIRLDDTWLMDTNNAWSQVATMVRPPARRWHAMAYDEVRNVTVLFGGDNNTLAGLADTWEFDGTTWTQRFSAHQPPARYGHVMTYDSIRRVTVMLGGPSDTALWVWNGTDWTSPSIAPTLIYSAMTFDRARGRVLVFGGKNPANNSTFGSSYEYDGVTWTAPSGVNPPPRFGHAMTYDSVRDCVVMAGGRDAAATTDTWEFRNGAWIQRTATLSNHYAPAMAFGFGRTCLFGGGTFPGVLADTYRYAATVPALYHFTGPGCGTADLHAASGELPYVGTTFVREVTGLPSGYPMFFGISLTPSSISLAPIGMPGCVLLADAPVVQAVFTSGTSATVPLAIPANTALQGIAFYDQAVIVAPGANALGLTLSNAQRGVTRLP